MTVDRTNPRLVELASVRRRVLAYLLDLCLVGGGVIAVVRDRERSLAGEVLSSLVVGTVAGTLYHVVLEGAGGRTVDKAALGIAVVREDGTDCTIRAAAVRTALRIVDALPVAYRLGLLSIAPSERRQRLGDRAANTVVIRTRAIA